jgi:hypothetical protein
VTVNKFLDVGGFVVYFLPVLQKGQTALAPVALQGTRTDVQHKAQILIVQQFFVPVENIVGMNERFQVFAYLVQLFGEFLHPLVKTIVVYKHNAS